MYVHAAPPAKNKGGRWSSGPAETGARSRPPAGCWRETPGADARILHFETTVDICSQCIVGLPCKKGLRIK